MKKLFSLFLISCGVSIMAQLPSGSTAPDFTSLDIFGNPHTLSAELAAGKTVILDFSSTGCGPCWQYHVTHALDDFYYAYGPQGSNEVEILHIEASFGSVNRLMGLEFPFGFGNWVEGTPYPIILDAALDPLYPTPYNPIVYRVCPTGTIWQIGQQTAEELRISANQCAYNNGVSNHIRMIKHDTGFCGPTDNFVAQFRNYGNNAVTSGTFQLKENGVVIQTKSFTGTVLQFETQDIVFDDMQLNTASTYTVEAIQVNGASNHQPSFSVADMPFHVASESGITVKVKIHMSQCPGNISWNIRNSLNEIVATGGPYPGAGTNPCGGPNAFSILEQNVNLPATADCYSVEMMDSAGYGWPSNYYNSEATPGIEVLMGTQILYSHLVVHNFGSLLRDENVFTTNGLSAPEANFSTELIYPNPANNLLQVHSDRSFHATLYDVAGKMVLAADQFSSARPMDISPLQPGIYFLKRTDDSGSVKTVKIVKQ